MLPKCWQDLYCKMWLSLPNIIVDLGSILIPLSIAFHAVHTPQILGHVLRPVTNRCGMNFPRLDIPSNLDGP